MKEYKILTQKDRLFAGTFDPEKLETMINSYAAHGWAVASIASASIPSLTGAREEMIIVMEREKKDEHSLPPGELWHSAMMPRRNTSR